MTEIVTLNVGGCLYQTSKETLSKNNNYFRALVEHSSCEDIIFIDRDPSLFRYILNWLRGTTVLPDDTLSLKELLMESDFYCMEEMKNEIVEKLTTSTTYLEEMKRFANELKYAYR
tara:strand:+ start:1520 stop:1867 length:348 start_codon:yes stop_codon:yes gene_type:complete